MCVCVSRGLIPIRRKSRNTGTTALRWVIKTVRKPNTEFTNTESTYTYLHIIKSGFFKYTHLSKGPIPRCSLENKNSQQLQFRQFKTLSETLCACIVIFYHQSVVHMVCALFSDNLAYLRKTSV
jgi:hypothetical protein